MNTEKTKEQIQQERHERYMKARQEEQNFIENLSNEIAESYGFSKEMADLIVSRGYSEGHSSGYNEVRSCAEDLADFVDQIINAYEKES